MASRARTRTLIAISAIAAAAALLPAGAGAAIVQRSGAVVHYTAGQGERNDVVVGRDVLLGQQVLTFTDNDANPISTGGNLCDLVNGVGTCSANGVFQIVVNARDKDDTITIATASPVGPVLQPTTLIGGRGVDVLLGGVGSDRLKGNNGRDSLRGRQGADFYKGGRGSDVLQTIDGISDSFISCGDGRRDLVRADRSDPRPKSCELGGRKRRGKRP